MRVLSWTLILIPLESEIFECELRSYVDDSTDFQDIARVHHRLAAHIEPNPIFDEVFNPLFSPFGDAKIVMYLETDIRLNGPGETPICIHRGDFELWSAGQVIGRGDLDGTEGLETHSNHASNEPCTAAGHGEGFLEGHVLQHPSKEWRNADIRATFSSHIDLSNNPFPILNLSAWLTELCSNPDTTDSPWNFWMADVDGVVSGGRNRSREEREREIEHEQEHEREHEQENEVRGRDAEGEPPRGEDQRQEPETQGREAENEAPRGQN